MNSAIFKTFLLSLCIVANTHLAMAQTASILPPAKTQYLDNSGKPLTSGKVFNYIPSTTTFKTTWQDAAETIANTNPVILDAGGRAKILGEGSYRQIVKDRYDNIIWDAVTSSSGSGGGGSTATGDGDLVGTIKPWAGMTAPNQYAFTYGQEVSRTTFSALFTAITSSQAIFCTSASPTLTGLSDTTNFWIGMTVEVSCVAAGFSTVVSKTASTVTMAANANVTTNTTAVFFPWGRGNGTTTFNLPDFRGIVPAGNNNMGGVASSNLTIPYFGATSPNSIGALGGAESNTLAAGNLPTHTHTSPVLTDPGHTHNNEAGSSGGGNIVGQGVAPSGTITGGTASNTTGITLSASTGTNASGLATPFSRVLPTKTSNYIIKITPDTNSATASGVTSLGGMTGDIACGTGLLCTGNTISTTTGGSTINFLNYGAVGNGIADNSVQFNAFIAAACSSGIRYAFMPNGVFNFTIQPNAISCPLTLYGAGTGATVLQRSYNGTLNTGLISFVGTAGNGSVIRDFTIQSGIGGFFGGNALSIVSTLGSANSFVTLENLILTTADPAGDNFLNVLYIDGSAANVGLVGVRDLNLKNIHVFGANNSSVVFRSAVGVSWNGGAVFPAGGTAPGTGHIEITGTSSVSSIAISIDIFEAAGLIFDYVNSADISIAQIAGAITSTSNSTLVKGSAGVVTGGISGSWTNSSFYVNDTINSSSAIQILNGAASQGMMLNCLLVSATYTSCPSGGGISMTGILTNTTARTITSGASATWDDINIAPATTTVTGTTGITAAAGFNKVSLYRPTITDASSVTIDNAATLYIDNAPLAAGSATITAPWALRTGAGQINFNSANEQGAFVDSLGTSRNPGVVINRNITSSASTRNEALLINEIYNNSTASGSATALLTELFVPAANSTNHATLTTWSAQNVIDGTGTISAQQALTAAAFNRSTATVSTQTGLSGQVTNTGAGTVTQSRTVYIRQPTGATAALTSTWTNIYGIDLENQTPSGAGTNTLTNAPIALNIQSQTASGAFAIKQSGSGINSFSSHLTMATSSSTLVLKQGANGTVGTFVCTSGGTIAVGNTNVAITDVISISLNTVGGTVSTNPTVSVITASSGFSAKCATSDTSTYNYAIIKNAA